MTINGIILINKDRGISSNSVVNKVKRIVGADKAGHFGTLDVLGEGLLPVALGKGTKLFDYFLNKDKVYKTTFKFGETTATLDLEGEVTNKNDVIVTKDDLLKVIPEFVGKFDQMPPQYSAKKINGRKAYELAREGKEVVLKPKEIEIYSIKLIKEVATNLFEFEIWCSSGTFIRSICRDIATRLNTYGVMSNIQRTRCGIFDLNNAVTLQELEKRHINIISLDKVFDYPSVKLDKADSERLLNGMTIRVDYNSDCEVKCYDFDNSFIGIGNISDKKLKLNLRLI